MTERQNISVIPVNAGSMLIDYSMLSSPSLSIKGEPNLHEAMIRMQINPKGRLPMDIKWLDKPEEHDYPAATSYLSLIMDRPAAKVITDKLKQVEMTEFVAKDIFRACGHPMLGITDRCVEKDLIQIARGEKLSPLLLYKDKANGKLIIADGYHRLCAVYKCDEQP